jgi:hypothetical protein
LQRKRCVTTLVTLLTSASCALAQLDAIITKLSKGILTVKEANELKEEADKGFTTPTGQERHAGVGPA